jgi:hypothetical protein
MGKEERCAMCMALKLILKAAGQKRGNRIVLSLMGLRVKLNASRLPT